MESSTAWYERNAKHIKKRKKDPANANTLFCDLCQIYNLGANALESHRNGKSHRTKQEQATIAMRNKALAVASAPTPESAAKPEQLTEVMKEAPGLNGRAEASKRDTGKRNPDVGARTSRNSSDYGGDSKSDHEHEVARASRRERTGRRSPKREYREVDQDWSSRDHYGKVTDDYGRHRSLRGRSEERLTEREYDRSGRDLPSSRTRSERRGADRGYAEEREERSSLDSNHDYYKDGRHPSSVSYGRRSPRRGSDERGSDWSYREHSEEGGGPRRSSREKEESRMREREYDRNRRGRSSADRDMDYSDDKRRRSSKGKYERRVSEGEYSHRTHDEGDRDGSSRDRYRDEYRSSKGKYERRVSEREYHHRSHHDGDRDGSSRDGSSRDRYRNDHRSSKGKYERRVSEREYDHRTYDEGERDGSSRDRYRDDRRERGRRRDRGNSEDDSRSEHLRDGFGKKRKFEEKVSPEASVRRSQTWSGDPSLNPLTPSPPYAQGAQMVPALPGVVQQQSIPSALISAPSFSTFSPSGIHAPFGSPAILPQPHYPHGQPAVQPVPMGFGPVPFEAANPPPHGRFPFPDGNHCGPYSHHDHLAGNHARTGSINGQPAMPPAHMGSIHGKQKPGDLVERHPSSHSSYPKMTVETWKAYERDMLARGGSDALAFKVVRDAFLSPNIGAKPADIDAMDRVMARVPSFRGEDSSLRFEYGLMPRTDLTPFGRGQLVDGTVIGNELEAASRVSTIVKTSITPQHRHERDSELIDIPDVTPEFSKWCNDGKLKCFCIVCDNQRGP